MTPDVFSLEPTVVPAPESLQRLRADWEAIHEESSVKSPFLSFEYLCLWYHSFAAEEASRVVRVENQGETVGFLPLVFSMRAGRRILSSLTNRHCLHCPPLIRKNRETQFAERLFPTLYDHRLSWDILRLGQYFSFNPEAELISESALSKSGLAHRRTMQPNFTIDLSIGFDQYYHHVMSSNLRKDIKRLRKRLQDAGTGVFQHYQRDEAVAHFGELLKLEDSGWKGRADSSILKLSQNYQRYYQGLVRLLAERNDLHLFFLDLDGQSIAGAFGYIEGEVFHWFKIGYREEYRELMPFKLLLLEMVRYLTESRTDVRRLHLFPGDGGYKHRWINEKSAAVEAVLFSDTLRGRTSHAVYQAHKRLRSIVRLKERMRRKPPGLE